MLPGQEQMAVRTGGSLMQVKYLRQCRKEVAASIVVMCHTLPINLCNELEAQKTEVSRRTMLKGRTVNYA